jgi:riboflavin synthase
MFTGIIETLATLQEVKEFGSGKTFVFSCPITKELKVDQSVSHNGVCLTVEQIDGEKYSLTAIAETLKVTTLGCLLPGDIVNLERCMKADGRYDGHLVQGHVDTVATCILINDVKGSWEYAFKLNDTSYTHLMVNKGSICINGVSLTLVNAREDDFSVSIIPYTYEHTNFHSIKVGTKVNIEFDILGKYIQRYLSIVPNPKSLIQEH